MRGREKKTANCAILRTFNLNKQVYLTFVIISFRKKEISETKKCVAVVKGKQRCIITLFSVELINSIDYTRADHFIVRQNSKIEFQVSKTVI